jgi:hypothetical protein
MLGFGYPAASEGKHGTSACRLYDGVRCSVRS